MTKRTVGGMLLGLLVSVTAALTSCSFPTYEIIVTGTGGASATSSSGGGNGGASSTGPTSSGSSASTATNSASSSSSSGGFDAGACPIDEDKDGVISWQCPGGMDCADQDERAKPSAGFTAGDPIKGLKRPGTLPYDFNCESGEEKQTVTLTCMGAVCADGTTQGFAQDVDCSDAGALGHCGGTLPCVWMSDSKSLEQLCK